LSCRRLVPNTSAVSTIAHFLHPRELLAWCEALDQHRPEVWLVTLAADAFDYGLYDLSPAAHGAVVRVRRLIAKVRPATIWIPGWQHRAT
jgi:hydrogenase maturation protease